MIHLQRARTGPGRISIVALATLVSAAAIAGSRYNPPGVVITRNADGTGLASGTLGGTRNSSNNVERLSCVVVRTDMTSAAGVPSRSSTVSCIARDSASVSATCVSTLESHATALDGVSNDSLIEFRYDASGRCASITVYESASLERKKP
jgi:hypothetical protein